MKSKMSVLRLAALAIALTMAQQIFAADFLEPAKIVGRIQKEIAKQSISTGGDLVDFELFDGVSTAIKYKLESVNEFLTKELKLAERSDRRGRQPQSLRR
jgi:hypothetical protein